MRAIQVSGPTTSSKGVLNYWLPRVLMTVALLVIFLRVASLVRAPSTKGVDLQSLNLTRLDGTPVQPDLLKGKSAIVNFWAPWCPPCRLEIPWLQHIQDSEAGKLAIIGVVADPDQYKNASQFMHQRGVTYLLVRDSPALDSAFGGVSVLPTSFYLAASGIVVHQTQGLIPEQLMLLYARQAMHHQ